MSKRVLVVDDHVPTRALIRTILEAEKTEQFEVFEAGTGTECLKAADKQGPFELVLLDVNLPDMDGYSVCRALRHVDKKVPIVFVTAKGDLKDYTAMNEAFKGWFGDEPPVRTTIAAAGGIPGNSLVEIDVIAYI